jgi:hypothetical protein
MQSNLLDLGLNFERRDIPFEDELATRLERLAWQSEPFNSFMYDEDDEPVLVKSTLHLRALRTFGKKGTPHLYLARQLRCSSIEEPIDDIIACKDISELEQIFETEKDQVEFGIANKVMFDGHRYWWRWKEEDGKVIFTERFIGAD